MAFVASTLWPKPLLNQNSRDMGAVYAGILFYSLVRDRLFACVMPLPSFYRPVMLLRHLLRDPTWLECPNVL